MDTRDVELLIPGPIPVSKQVLEVMSHQVEQHYGPDWMPFYETFIARLRRVFASAGTVYPIPASGSGGLDAVIGSLVGVDGKIGVITNGFFGDRVVEIARAYSSNVEVLEVPWDRAADPDDVRRWARTHKLPLIAVVHSDTATGVLNPVQEIAAAVRPEGAAVAVDAVSSLGGAPVETDKWGLAAVSTASQKCLESPPGLAPVAITRLGWEVIDRQPNSRGWYLNLRTWRRFEREWGAHHPYPVTIPSNLIRALDRALQLILDEGLEKRFERHRRAQAALREGLERIGFTPAVEAKWASPTVTVAYPPAGVDANAVIRNMRTRGLAISGGLAKLSGKVIRVGHLGTQAHPELMRRVVDALEASVREGAAAKR
ncbi:MAG TPA: alanine--glyoxylate aminotransferase family protein [bacterium]|nr:alanine--glyoxylate aminotransferase family protein [bacterium]